MEENQVSRIKFLRGETARLVNEIQPQNAAEWDAKEKLTDIHKKLRQIDDVQLAQLSLLPQDNNRPAEPSPCPTCNGTGQVVEEVPDADGSGATNLINTACPKCLGTGQIPAQASLDSALDAAITHTTEALSEGVGAGAGVAEGENADPPGGLRVEQEDHAADKAFEDMGDERDAANAADEAERSQPVDLAKLHIKVGQDGERHMINLNGFSAEGKQLRNTLVKVFQKAGLIEHAKQLDAVIASFPDSEGKRIALAVAEGRYGQAHDEGDEQPN